MANIYLDGNASARLRPGVRSALSALEGCQNPSSIHRSGRAARALLRTARRQVLELAGFSGTGKAARLIFTSGGTEASNLLCLGFLGSPEARHRSPGHIVSTAIEHPATLSALQSLRELGWSIDLLDPEANGVVSVESAVAAVRPETVLVAVMSANNETGAIQPVKEIAERLRGKKFSGAIVSDFVQALGKGQISAPELFHAGVDALAVSAHKIGALAGTGAVILRDASLDRGRGAVCRELHPMLFGGFQEEGFRPGTENLFGAVAFGAVAAEVQREELTLAGKYRSYRESLWTTLAKLEGASRIGPEDDSQVLANTLMVRFAGLRADDLVVALDVAGVMASTGSACASGKQGVSSVLQSMGFSSGEAREAIRFSFDWATTPEEVAEAGRRICVVVTRAAELAKGHDRGTSSSAQEALGRSCRVS